MPLPAHNLFNTRRTLESGTLACSYYSLPALAEAGIGSIATLPVSLRILLESLLRNYDGHQITEANVTNLANWDACSPKAEENSVQASTRRSTGFHRCPAGCRYCRNAFRCRSTRR